MENIAQKKDFEQAALEDPEDVVIVEVWTIRRRSVLKGVAKAKVVARERAVANERGQVAAVQLRGAGFVEDPNLGSSAQFRDKELGKRIQRSCR